jgi:signal transduction histidine kinase/ActR/RegA family two-component response regulator
MNVSVVPALTFLANGGQTGALMRAHDWSSSPLGPPESWPQSLRSIVGMLLNSKFPMFIAWGPELGFLYNDPYAEILGDKHPAALGRRFQSIWAEIWNDILPSIEQAMAGHAVYHHDLPLTMNRKGYDEQTWFTFSYSPVRDESGDVAGMFCAVTETTEQVLAERHRTEELKRLQRLFQQAPGIIAVLRGPQHIFDIANDAFCGLIGRHDVLGKPVREVLPELAGQGFFELLDEAYATGEPFFGNELPVSLQRRPDGALEQRFVSFIYQPTFDHRGHITGIFMEGGDVTETVRTHQALQASENELKAANRRKDEFLAMLAHELRNPLAPIATAAALLKMSTLDDARIRRTGDIISRQVAHMTELVDDLLDVSRVTRGLVTLQEETLDLGGLLAGAAEQAGSLIDAKRQHFSVQLPEEQVFVRGDRTRLIQVFSNILNNATKYTPPGGHVSLGVVTDAMRVQVAIEDDGVGIAPALLPHIFDLFTQGERSPDRAQGGLGLGLALVKNLLELQGGTVSAHSAGAGQGSRFTVCLPRVTAPGDRPAPSGEASAKPGAAGTRVLVVDDNKDAAETLQLLLEAEGHEALVAHSAHDALAIARQTSPAILFLDIGLPDVDGYELARRLRALPELAHASLVAVTGYGQPKDKARAIEAGFDHHLVKPARLADVLALLPRTEQEH